MKQYICTKSWARNNKGDIVAEWELARYPSDVVAKHFKPYNKRDKDVKAPTAPTKPQPTNIHEEIQPKPQQTTKARKGGKPDNAGGQQ